MAVFCMAHFLIDSRMKYTGGFSESVLSSKSNMTKASMGNKKGPMCQGCGQPISDQYVLKIEPNLNWHTSCLKCEECSKQLDEAQTCYMKNGKIYCKMDYIRLFQPPQPPSCFKCGIQFTRADLVMSAGTNVFHVNCFKCCSCDVELRPGSKFSHRSLGLLCEKHDNQYSAAFLSPDSGAGDTSVSIKMDDDSPTMTDMKDDDDNGVDLLSNSPDDDDQPSSTDEAKVSLSKVSHGGGKRSSKDGRITKTTRVRTVLNENQLQTLRSCYAANPRPDALMKEQLVDMTKLTPRVIRVWFQNKRCKDKKRTIQLKHLHQNEKLLGNGLQAVPMVAASPMRHDTNQPLGASLQSQMELPFCRPWKTMDYTLHMQHGGHGDLGEHVSFQTMMQTGAYPCDEFADEYCLEGLVPDSSSICSRFSSNSESPQSTA